MSKNKVNFCYCECHLVRRVISENPSYIMYDDRVNVCDKCKEISCALTQDGVAYVPTPVERDLNERLKMIEELLRLTTGVY